MNEDSIQHWARVLAGCAADHSQPSSLPSPTLALLRRMASGYARGT